MKIKEMVLEILSHYKDKFVGSQVVTDDLMKTPELKLEAKECKKPRLEGGLGWDDEKTSKNLDEKYRPTVRWALFSLRESKFVEILALKNDPKKMKGVVLSKKKAITKKEVAHRITKLGLKYLDNLRDE